MRMIRKMQRSPAIQMNYGYGRSFCEGIRLLKGMMDKILIRDGGKRVERMLDPLEGLNS